MTYQGFDGTYYNYQKTSNENTRLRRPIQLGDRMEFEISQFSAPGIPNVARPTIMAPPFST